MAKYVIGVDLGGTRLRAGLMDRQLNFIERAEILTRAHEGRDPTIERIKGIIDDVLPADRGAVSGIGVSVPGPCNPETGVVVAPPNLPGWQDVPLSRILGEAFDLPIYLGNDANVAALAEASVGSAQGYRHVIYVTVSTGIGSGIINDGRLVLGKTGIANEAGHMVMLMEEGRVSTLEKEAAGPALARQAREQIRAGRHSILQEMTDGDLDKIDGKMISDAVQAGDALAIELARRGGKIVGLGLVNLLHIFNPEVVVIGGGVSYMGDIWFDEVRNAVREHTIDDDYWKDTPIIQSQISEDVSIIGAATLVLTEGNKKKLTNVVRKLDS